jgi:hypothetical protein
MADIREALRERLASIEAELHQLTRRRDRLSALKDTVHAALAQEDALYNISAGHPEIAIHPTGRGSLSDLIMQALERGPKTLEQLKKIGADWFPPETAKQPGRVINFALVGLQKGGHVKRLENGAWQLASGESRK